MDAVQALLFQVVGRPIAQPRVKVAVRVTRHGKRTGRAYVASDHPVHAYKQALALQALQALVTWKAKTAAVWDLQGPFEVRLTFVLARPVGFRAAPGLLWHARRPDADNLAKAVYDALKDICWHEDAQIVRATLDKLTAAVGQEPFTHVQIQRLLTVGP